jgi:hypothetical protein
LLPIIIVDLVTFYFIDWGYQLLIVAIESFVFSIMIIVLSLIEFFRIKSRFFKDEDESYLAINPKMFDNAYTVAGGVPNLKDKNQTTKMHIEKHGGVGGFDASRPPSHSNSYSYNLEVNDMTRHQMFMNQSKYKDPSHLVDNESKDKRLNLHHILNKLHERNPLYGGSAINVMNLKDNQIFKNRKHYEENVKLDEEENFDKFDRKQLRR